jgi:type I restriction enzyme S subunit
MIKKKAPKLRFSEFQEELVPQYLSEILDFKNGINADKSQYGKGRKFINVLDIINDSPIYHDSIIGSIEITDKEFDNNDIQYGDILFQRSSETRKEAGQSNIYLDSKQKATFGGFVIRGRPKIEFSPIYFNYLLKTRSVRKEITDRSGGSTRFNIGQNSLSEVLILICSSIAEQEKIASFLGTIDTRLTQLRRKRELLQTYKRGVMQKIFSQEVRFKGDDRSDFPEWEEKKLGEIFLISAGGDIELSRVKKEKDEIYQYPVYANAEKEKGLYGYSDQYKFEGGVITVTGRGNLGFANVRDHRFYPIVRLLILRPKLNLSIWFFENYINRIHIYAETTGVPQLTVPQLSSYKVNFPLVEEQEKIADFLTTIDRKIEAISQQIDRTEQFKKGLLQKMFV